MPAPPNITKAELREIEWDSDRNPSEINKEKTVKVQFNPETLRVTFSAQRSGGDQSGGAASQFLGTGTTKLSLDLWFDVTVPTPEGTKDPAAPADDVRRITQRVAYFITPQKNGDQWVPPGVRFVWGTFIFDGIMESLNEELDFFSEEGKPLRAKMSITIGRQDVYFEFAPTGESAPGTTPQTPAKSGDSIQQMAANAGKPGDWKNIASANGIENPRQVQPGQFVNLNAKPKGNRT